MRKRLRNKRKAVAHIFMVSDFCPGAPIYPEVEKIYTLWNTVGLGRDCPCIWNQFWKQNRGVFLIMPHRIFAFESIITKPSPQTTAKTSHASYTHFSLPTSTHAPTKGPAHSRVSLKFFSNTVVTWLSSTKQVLSAVKSQDYSYITDNQVHVVQSSHHYRRTPGQAPHVKLPSRSQALSSTPGSLSSLSGTRAANLKSRRPIQRGVELLLNLKFRSGAKEEQRPEVGDLLHCFSAREPFGDQSGRNSKCWVFLQAPPSSLQTYGSPTHPAGWGVAVTEASWAEAVSY